jgi:hypothetical protein
LPLTCADWLPVLQLHLKEPLFTPRHVERLRSLARRLPGDGQGVLEARLAPGSSAPIDLSLRLLDDRQAHEMAERLPPSHLQEFLRRWSRREEPLVPVRAVWLEFDLDREPEGIPAPVVCAKLPPGLDRCWLTGSLIPALHGMPLSARQLEHVHRCLDELPASASLLYVFSLRSRGGEAVRLEVFGMEPAGIPGYLRRVAPEGIAVALEAALLFEGVERIHLSFDIAEEILPRVGIEGSFPRLPPREPRWAELFDRLVKRGLCSAGKRDAALAWPGYDSFWTAPSAWPLAAGVRRVCARGLSHVKIVCRPGAEPEAKVYLAFEPLERSGAGAVASSPARRSVSST